jgi:uncharacterized protein YegL
MKTIIKLILDRSGSMAGKESDVVGGVNNFIEEQRKVEQPAVISLVRFDTEVEEFRKAVDLPYCQPLSALEFHPRGNTALLDAIGQTLNKMEVEWAIHRPDHAIVVVCTDGEENASREFTKERIRQMIESREKSGQWTFIYLGASVNAFAEARSYGFQTVNTTRYVATPMGTRTAYGAAGQSVSNMRATGDMEAKLGEDLPENMDDAVAQINEKFAKDPATPRPDEPTASTWSPPKEPAEWRAPA